MPSTPHRPDAAVHAAPAVQAGPAVHTGPTGHAEPTGHAGPAARTGSAVPAGSVDPKAGPSDPADPPGGDARSRRAGWIPAGRSDRLIAVSALWGALLMWLHAQVPNGFGLGSLLETFLPWAGLGVPVLLAFAVVRRSRFAAVAVVVPAVAWVSLFGGVVVDKTSAGGDLVVVTHNVGEANREPGRTARALALSGADVLALEELSSKTAPVYERELAANFPYHSVHQGVGLWSTYPLRDVEPVPIMPWTRAVRATVHTPKGPVAVFAAHLASVRVSPAGGFATARRNEAGRNLAEVVRAERLPRVVVVGDFNGTGEDTALRPLTSQLRSAQGEAGAGFGFTWPASFPLVRIDQIFVRGVSPVSSWSLPATGSDHLPVAASLRL
ncbi:endonuclease/exonuclease/phosphatase family protein [Streptomyces flavochromogenes]|uniref:endonuclease/exonuclease/phosphatase family protein n=1 Tax=Streptomyces flavochromogenes TaxID=68199 RepID=UPI00099E0132|nr:endonuclease/exonuclease/phosphatase family protein [Streptomyces flavochromogenes]